MADAIRGTRFGIGAVGVLQGIHLGGPTAWKGDNSYTRALQVGARRNDTEGLLAPSMELQHVGFWRFRWPVTAGNRSLSIYVKQPANVTPRPALIVKANPDVGLAADVTEVAPNGSGWVKIGPATFAATATGVVWVELHNRAVSQNAPCYFDFTEGDLSEEFSFWVNGAPVAPSGGGGGGPAPTATGSRRVAPGIPRSRTPL